MGPRPLPQPTANSPLKRLSSLQKVSNNNHYHLPNDASFNSVYSDPVPVLSADATYSTHSNAALVIPSSHSPSSSFQTSPNIGSEGGMLHTSSSTSTNNNYNHMSNVLSPQLSDDSFSGRNQYSNTNNYDDSTSPTAENFDHLQDSNTAVDTHHQEITKKESFDRPDYHIKIVCVGDGGCGKTSLMLTYTIGKFPTTYVPTVFENYLTNIRAPDGKLIELALWDTAGQEEYDRLRVLSYPEVNILLVCFGIDSPTSLENVIDKWLPEVSHFCPDIPILLVGLKLDLRTEISAQEYLHAKNIKCITKEQGESVAKKIGARGYLECSARMSWGVSNIFTTAMEIVLNDHFGVAQQQQKPQEQKEQQSLPTKEKKPLNNILKSSKSVKKNNDAKMITSSKNQKLLKKKKRKCIIL